MKCRYRLNPRAAPATHTAFPKNLDGPPCQTLDVVFTTISTSTRIFSVKVSEEPKVYLSHSPAAGSHATGRTVQRDVILPAGPGKEKSKAEQYFWNALLDNIEQYGSETTALKLFLPVLHGYIVRNDIIKRRFLDCELARESVCFSSPRKYVQAFTRRSDNLLEEALKNAMGLVRLPAFLASNPDLVDCALHVLENEVSARLSFAWIIDSPIPRERLAIVEGRPHPDESAAVEGPLRAAAALGIDLVILDEEGHWLQKPENASLRDEFIVCDLRVDENLPDRIVDALSKSKVPVDGIVTYSDKRLSATAKAAQILGIGTYLPEAIDACTNKQKMRELTSPSLPIISTTGAFDLERQLRTLRNALAYPLIVKPTTGNSSEGVIKVSSEAELLAAVFRIETHFPGKSMLIEPYASGPEVDANFVLLNGQVLFSEINDDFPSLAEIPEANSSSFAEMSTIMPSVLPKSELGLIEQTLVNNLISLGFRTGVFHIEARLRHSRMKYCTGSNGVDLLDHQQIANGHTAPEVFLIEINARTPGHQESFATEYTYGIDYYALYHLLALSPPSAPDSVAGNLKSLSNTEIARIDAMCHPFAANLQHPTNIVFIPVSRFGTFVSAKPLPDSLMQHVYYWRVMIKKGEVIEDPEATGKWPFVAYFLVKSQMTGADGREQVRTLGERVREHFEYEVM